MNSGGVSIVLNEHSNVGDSSVGVNSGQLSLHLWNQCTLQENSAFDLSVNSGQLNAEVTLPEGVGGDFYGMVNSGISDISGTMWNTVSEGHYQSPSYASATQSVTIFAAVNSGILDANLF